MDDPTRMTLLTMLVLLFGHFMIEMIFPQRSWRRLALFALAQVVLALVCLGAWVLG